MLDHLLPQGSPRRSHQSQAPRLIKAETVAKMKPGSIILDMAVETGGNVEGSKNGENVVTDNGVTILGIPNIPSTVSTEASALYARNVLNFLDTLFDAEKNFAINPEEEIQKALLVTHGGQVLLKRG
jgi:H+-translocating NAD(P) transhydrogenase subunit alpha